MAVGVTPISIARSFSFSPLASLCVCVCVCVCVSVCVYVRMCVAKSLNQVRGHFTTCFPRHSLRCHWQSHRSSQGSVLPLGCAPH